jgi:hypothetical protein
MAYLIERNGEYKIVDYEPASGYIDKGTRQELMKYLQSAPETKEEARRRQIQFLKRNLTENGVKYLKNKGTYEDMDIV